MSRFIKLVKCDFGQFCFVIWVSFFLGGDFGLIELLENNDYCAIVTIIVRMGA